MNAVALGIEVARRRKEAGLTQAELARSMGTTQSAISKIEGGRTLPTLPLLERLALATGRPLEIVLGSRETVLDEKERARRVRRVLGDYRFNPWDRSPSPAEAKTLIADGLTRERFEGTTPDRAGSLDGDEARTVEVPVGSGTARLIGLDDLYLDRLRQATMNEGREGIEFESALAVVAANIDAIDWTYVRARMQQTLESDRPLGEIMKRIDARIRRRARQRLSEAEP